MIGSLASSVPSGWHPSTAGSPATPSRGNYGGVNNPAYGGSYNSATNQQPRASSNDFPDPMKYANDTSRPTSFNAAKGRSPHSSASTPRQQPDGRQTFDSTQSRRSSITQPMTATPPPQPPARKAYDPFSNALDGLSKQLQQVRAQSCMHDCAQRRERSESAHCARVQYVKVQCKGVH